MLTARFKELADLINNHLIPKEAIDNIPKKLVEAANEPPIVVLLDGDQRTPDRVTLKIVFDATLGIPMTKRYEDQFSFDSDAVKFIPEVGQFNIIEELNKICPGSIVCDRSRDSEYNTESVLVITNPLGLLNALKENDNLAKIRANWIQALNQSQSELKKFQHEKKPDLTLTDLTMHYVNTAVERHKKWKQNKNEVEAKLSSFPFYPEKNVKEPYSYSAMELKAIIQSVEDFFKNSSLQQDKWSHYRLATCYGTAANKVMKDNKQEARNLLMKAKEHMHEYYKNIESVRIGTYSEEYNWFQPQSAFYLGDFYQTLGMLSESKVEQAQHFKSALKYYMEAIQNPYKVTQINSRFETICKKRIKMMGFASNYELSDKETLGQALFDCTGIWCEKHEKDMPFATAVKLQESLNSPSLETKATELPSAPFVPIARPTPSDPMIAKLASWFPYRLDNIPDLSTYKLDELLEVVNAFEKNPSKALENITDYQIATCYMTLVGKISEEIVRPMAKEEFSKELKDIKSSEGALTRVDIQSSPIEIMKSILIKAKDHMLKYGNDSFKRDPAEQAFFQPRSDIYLADIYKMLGFISTNKVEKEKYYDLALSFYANVLDPVHIGGQYFDICKAGIRSIAHDNMHQAVKAKFGNYLYDHDSPVQQVSINEFPFNLNNYISTLDYFKSTQERLAKAGSVKPASEPNKGSAPKGPGHA